MLLKGTNFLTFYNRYPERCSQLKLLKEWVLINNLYTAHPEKTDFLFHPSDWVPFGLKEDVQAIWDIPLAPEPETSRWFFDKERPASDPVLTWLFRYIPEQYSWISFLKKHLTVDFQHFSDCTPANKRAFYGEYG